LALYAAGNVRAAVDVARERIDEDPTDPIPRALAALCDGRAMKRFARDLHTFLGEEEFEILETSLVCAELGLKDDAARLLEAVCVEAMPETDRGPLPLYYLAYFHSRRGDEQSARRYLRQAGKTRKDSVFPSRPEAVPVLEYAVEANPADACAHLHLGNLYGDLGRLDEARGHWRQAARLDPSLSVAFRNLGLAGWALEHDLPKAAALYRKAIAARPEDQTLYRDLAQILVADGKRPEAIRLLESMPSRGQRRSEIVILLAEAYLAQERYTDTIDLLEPTPYFVNWEGQDITWVLFNKAHLKRGRRRLGNGEFQAALEDFKAALTYPENLGVGRSNTPEEAPAEYWRGKALEALGRLDEARSAWAKGAAGSQGSQQQNRYRALCREKLQTPPAPPGKFFWHVAEFAKTQQCWFV